MPASLLLLEKSRRVKKLSGLFPFDARGSLRNDAGAKEVELRKNVLFFAAPFEYGEAPVEG